MWSGPSPAPTPTRISSSTAPSLAASLIVAVVYSTKWM